MIPIFSPKEETKVADIARLHEELQKCSTLSETLKKSFEHWKVFPPRPSTDNYFRYLLQILLAIAALMIR